MYHCFPDKKLRREEGGGCTDEEGFYRRSHGVLSAQCTHRTSQCPQIMPDISEEGDNVNFQKTLEHESL